MSAICTKSFLICKSSKFVKNSFLFDSMYEPILWFINIGGKKWKKVPTSVNAIGRKEKTDNKLALEKEDEKADSSTSSSLGAQS